MKRRGFFFYRQFLSALLILSVSFTQAFPAFALRGEQGSELAATRKLITAGLEEAPAGLLDRLSPNAAHHYLAYVTSRYNPEAARRYYDMYHSGRDNTLSDDCRICSMRGNVFAGIPRMLHLMLTGGYDGAGIDIQTALTIQYDKEGKATFDPKAAVRTVTKYHIVDDKDKGHLDALLLGMFENFEEKLKQLVASEYGVSINEVKPLSDAPDVKTRLENSFELDKSFGDMVFRMKVGQHIISIPMVAIGHTRWSTVGKGTKPNAHPFHLIIPGLFLPDGRPFEVALAHNGDFRVYNLFSPIILEMGVDIKGETDSEILAAVLGYMHRGRDGKLISLPEAVARLLRFVKYAEDFQALISILESETADAQKYHDAVVRTFRQELALWGISVPAQAIRPDIIKLAKENIHELIRKGLQEPWFFNSPEVDGRLDLATAFVTAGEPVQTPEDPAHVKKQQGKQKELRQRFFDQSYSTIAITAMNNAEEGLIVARGRTGGDLEVYIPPLRAVSERMIHLNKQLEAASVPSTVAEAQKQWLFPIQSVLQELEGLLSTWRSGNLWLDALCARELLGLQQHVSRLKVRIERLTGSADLNAIRNGRDTDREPTGLLPLFRAVQKFAAQYSQDHDTGRRVAASEPRAMPGLPGTARPHSEERFRSAGRGEMDARKVNMGNIVHFIGRDINISSVWENELKPNERLDAAVPDRRIVDLANLELGGADSRLEREIGNQVTGWINTLAQFRNGTFPDLNYKDEELKDIEELYFVAEGTSAHLSMLATMVADAVPNGRIHFVVEGGTDFQARIANGQLAGKAKELAKRGKKINVTFVTNTGQTETVRDAAAELNKLNTVLKDVELEGNHGTQITDCRVLMSVITNVAGSAVDTEVQKGDDEAQRHAIYTLAGYEMAVPATGSLNVGVIAAGLFVTYVQAIQGALPRGRLDFTDRLSKLDRAVRDLQKILEASRDGSLQVTPNFKQYVDNVLGRMDPTAIDPLIWITGWWIFAIGSNETRLKFQEALRAKGVSSWQVIDGKHGPYAILRAGATAIAFVPSRGVFPEGHQKMIEGLQGLRSRIDDSEGYEKIGNIIVIMAEEDVDTSTKIGLDADVLVPLPHMDDPYTGFMFSMLFTQLVALYGARERFEPLRQELVTLNEQIVHSGILGKQLPLGQNRALEVWHNSAELLRDFAENQFDERKFAEDLGRAVLTELRMRDKDHFHRSWMQAQARGNTYTEVAMDVAKRVRDREIDDQYSTDKWDAIRRYAEGMYLKIKERHDKLTARRQAIQTALAEHGLSADNLREKRRRFELYSLTLSEAIRFARDVRSWREYTETYVKHLSKQISGVKFLLDKATRDLLLDYSVSQQLQEEILDSFLTLQNGQVTASRKVLDLVSQATGKPKNDLLRVGLHHEGTEMLLRMLDADFSLRQAFAKSVNPDELSAFRNRFEAEFGRIDPDAWYFEVAAQYYTAQFTGDTLKLNQLYGTAISNAVKRAVEGIRLPDGAGAANLHELLTMQLSDLKLGQIETLKKVERALARFSEGRNNLSVQFDQKAQEVESLRLSSATHRPSLVLAGMEEENDEKIRQFVLEIGRQIGIYGLIRNQTSAPKDAPFGEKVEEVNALISQQEYDAAERLLQQFKSELDATTLQGAAEIGAKKSLEKVLERALVVFRDLKALIEKIRRQEGGSLLQQTIERLLGEYKQTRVLQFAAVEGSPGQTVLVAVADVRLPGIHDALVHPVTLAGLSIQNVQTQTQADDGTGVDIVTVAASAANLTPVLDEIRRALQRLSQPTGPGTAGEANITSVNTPAELENFLLARGRHHEETRFYGGLYRQFLDQQGIKVISGVHRFTTETKKIDRIIIAAILPYRLPENEITAQAGLSNEIARHAPNLPHRVDQFVVGIKDPNGAEAALIHIVLNAADLKGETDDDLKRAIETIISPWARTTATGLEEQVTMPKKEAAKVILSRARGVYGYGTTLPTVLTGDQINPVNVGDVLDAAAKDGMVTLRWDGARNNRVNVMRPTGLEELIEGIHYRFDDNYNAVLVQNVEVRRPTHLTNGVTFNPQGNSIVIGQGTRIYKEATLQGSIVIDKNSEVGGILVGFPDKPLVIGDSAKIHRPDVNVKGSVIGPQTHINGAEVSGSTVVPFIRDGSVASARVESHSHVLNGSVVFGATVGTGIKIYDHHVVGPFVRIANNSEHDEGFFWGVDAKAPIFFPHHGYTETLWALSAAIEDIPLFTQAYYDRLRQIMRAVAFGKLLKMEQAEEAPVSSSGVRLVATFDLDGNEISFPVQRINFGANTITSDYNPLTGARASGSAMAGVATGVNSVPKLPVALGSRALVGNLSEASGIVNSGMLIAGSPVGIVKGNRVEPLKADGYRSVERGFSLGEGILQEIEVQMDYFHRLAMTAEVLAEAADRASDPFTLAGYVASLRAIQGSFSGIGPRYSKLVNSVEISLKTLRAQRALENDPARQVRLDARISDQESLLKDKDKIVAEITRFGVVVDSAVNSVASVTQVSIADSVRQQILQPDFVWKNPLAGLEETVVSSENVSLPSAKKAQSFMGLVVGNDPLAYAYGVAAARRVRNVRVAFVVTKNDPNRAGLLDWLAVNGIMATEIFYSVEAAEAYLAKFNIPIENMPRLGIDEPVSKSVGQIFHNLFGIELNTEEIALWQSFIDKISGTFMSQA